MIAFIDKGAAVEVVRPHQFAIAAMAGEALSLRSWMLHGSVVRL
jgi:hypothetical protein